MFQELEAIRTQLNVVVSELEEMKSAPMYFGKDKKTRRRSEEAGRRDKELKGSTLGGTTGKPEAEGRHIRYDL